MAAPIQSTTHSYLTSRAADKVYFEGYTEKPSQWGKVMKKETMKFSDYIERNFASFGYMQENYEGANFVLDDITQGYSKTITPVTRSLGFEVTEDAKMDDRWGIISQLAKELGKSANATMELVAWLTFNQAFAGPRVGLDGSYLCVDSHASIGSLTSAQDNLVTGALSTSTLQDAITLFKTIKLSNGRPAAINPDILIVAAGSANYWVGKDLVKNEWQYNSADKNLNPIQNEGISLLAVDWLTTSTNWFLVSKADMGVKLFSYMDTKQRSGVDQRTGNEYMSVKSRMTSDFFNWQGVVGSTGA